MLTDNFVPFKDIVANTLSSHIYKWYSPAPMGAVGRGSQRNQEGGVSQSLRSSDREKRKSLGQWCRTVALQMFLAFNSQKSWPEEVVVKASGS